MTITDKRHSPARIIQKLLQDVDIVSNPPEETEEWPAFVSSMDDTEDSPDKAVCVYDTSGLIDGRSMKTGEVWRHEGFTIRVRSTSYDEGHDKAKEIYEHLTQEVQRTLVFVEAAVYLVHSISMTTGIVALGESESRGRRNWTLNGIVSLTNYTEELED